LGYSTVARWGGTAVSVPNYRPPAELQALENAASTAGIGLIGRAQGRSAFTDDEKLNYEKLAAILNEVFAGNDLAGDLVGY
jgi:hypothetical protein